MPSKPAAANGRSATFRYHWVLLWLSCACLVALLLLANAVRDYRFVSRVLATQQVRHQITQLSTLIEQETRRNGLAAETLQKSLANSARTGESINLRAADGTLLEHYGESFPTKAFSLDEEHAAFARHEQLSRTVPTPAGEFVIEATPIRIPPRTQPAAPPSGPPRPMILEFALPLRDADAAILTPIRRNLTINCIAALSLLATVLLSWIGLRRYEQGRRYEEQIEIARQVQARLLPPIPLDIPGFQIATEYQPSEQVGGDFYDIFPVSAACLACVIGDVSGKGIPAALLMGVIHGAVRTADWHGTAAEHEAESGRLNRLLCDRASGNRFASMFWCVYDPATSTLRYVNAGHCPPFLVGYRDGQLQAMRLDQGGPVLGLLPFVTYQATTIQALPGDLLVLHSDGLVEAANATGEEFGDLRLQTLILSHFQADPGKLREETLRALNTFTSQNIPQDDLTFAIIRL